MRVDFVKRREIENSAMLKNWYAVHECDATMMPWKTEAGNKK